MNVHPVFRNPGILARAFAPSSWSTGVVADYMRYKTAEHNVDIFSGRFSKRELLHAKWSKEVLESLKDLPSQLDWFLYTPHDDDNVAISSGAIPGMHYLRAQDFVRQLQAITGLAYFYAEESGQGPIITIQFPVYHRSLLQTALEEKRDELLVMFRQIRAQSDFDKTPSEAHDPQVN